VNKTVAMAKKADRTAYNVRYSCRTEPPTCRCDLHGNADVITLFTSHAPATSTAELSYRFLSFGLFCGLTIHPVAKVSQEVNRKMLA